MIRSFVVWNVLLTFLRLLYHGYPHKDIQSQRIGWDHSCRLLCNEGQIFLGEGGVKLLWSVVDIQAVSLLKKKWITKLNTLNLQCLHRQMNIKYIRDITSLFSSYQADHSQASLFFWTLEFLCHCHRHTNNPNLWRTARGSRNHPLDTVVPIGQRHVFQLPTFSPAHKVPEEGLKAWGKCKSVLM